MTIHSYVQRLPQNLKIHTWVRQQMGKARGQGQVWRAPRPTSFPVSHTIHHPESALRTCVYPNVPSELTWLLERLPTVRARVGESTPVDVPVVRPGAGHPSATQGWSGRHLPA